MSADEQPQQEEHMEKWQDPSRKQTRKKPAQVVQAVDPSIDKECLADCQHCMEAGQLCSGDGTENHWNHGGLRYCDHDDQCVNGIFCTWIHLWSYIIRVWLEKKEEYTVPGCEECRKLIRWKNGRYVAGLCIKHWKEHPQAPCRIDLTGQHVRRVDRYDCGIIGCPNIHRIKDLMDAEWEAKKQAKKTSIPIDPAKDKALRVPTCNDCMTRSQECKKHAKWPPCKFRMNCHAGLKCENGHTLWELQNFLCPEKKQEDKAATPEIAPAIPAAAEPVKPIPAAAEPVKPIPAAAEPVKPTIQMASVVADEKVMEVLAQMMKGGNVTITSTLFMQMLQNSMKA